MYLRTNRGSRGFTLIEMTLVALVVMIIATMALASMQRARGQALEVAAEKALKAIDEAQELYYQRNGFYAREFRDLTGTYLPSSYRTSDAAGIFAKNYSLIFIHPGEVVPPYTPATGSFSTFANFTVVAEPYDRKLRTFITSHEGRVQSFPPSGIGF
ncbi:MAG TPA: type II secretion system protein [bacterium]|nr:type II secretion system protein [bacterium]